MSALSGPGERASVERAKAIATSAHLGQVDKAGHPYIGHPARIAARVAGDSDAECVAWLHDVVEDTDVTFDDLRADFSDDVVEAIDAITRRPDEHSFNYYMRVRANELAMKVKLADVADNSDPERLALLDAPTRGRLGKKYKLAVDALTTSGHYVLWTGPQPGGEWRINVDSGALVFEASNGRSDWGHAIDAEQLPAVVGALGMTDTSALFKAVEGGLDLDRGWLEDHEIPFTPFRWP